MTTSHASQRPIFVVARKELFGLLHSPAMYIVCVLFLVTAGWMFAVPLFQVNQSTLDTFVRPLPLLFTFLIPALTMRSFSEEFKTGTIEFIATMPIKDYQIVLGKYLGALGWLAILVSFTLAYPIILAVIGNPDPGQIAGTYIAVFSLGAFFAAIGVWASAMTRNQVVAFIVSFFISFTLYLLDRLSEFMPGSVALIIRAVSVGPHFDSLTRGVVDSRDLMYWLSGCIFFLSACLAAIHSRRWR